MNLGMLPADMQPMPVMMYWAVTRLPLIGLDLPEVAVVLEHRRRDAGVELDVAAEVETVGDVLEVGEDLGLLGELAAPTPLLEQLAGEREAVDVALGVAAGAGVAIPIPGAADAAAGFVDLDGEAHFVSQPPAASPGPRSQRR